jgi:hypothetical protein
MSWITRSSYLSRLTQKKGGQYVVGWYKDATVYRKAQPSSAEERQKFSCFAGTPAGDAFRLPERKRVWRIPGGKGNLGTANVWYLYDETGNPKSGAGWLNEALFSCGQNIGFVVYSTVNSICGRPRVCHQMIWPVVCSGAIATHEYPVIFVDNASAIVTPFIIHKRARSKSATVSDRDLVPTMREEFILVFRRV